MHRCSFDIFPLHGWRSVSLWFSERNGPPNVKWSVVGFQISRLCANKFSWRITLATLSTEAFVDVDREQVFPDNFINTIRKPPLLYSGGCVPSLRRYRVVSFHLPDKNHDKQVGCEWMWKWMLVTSKASRDGKSSGQIRCRLSCCRSDFMSRFRKPKTGNNGCEGSSSSGLPIGQSGHAQQRQNIPSSSSSGRGFHIWRRSKEVRRRVIHFEVAKTGVECQSYESILGVS